MHKITQILDTQTRNPITQLKFMLRVSFISSIDINHVGVKHVMFDEFFGDFGFFKEETKEKVITWGRTDQI